MHISFNTQQILKQGTGKGSYEKTVLYVYIYWTKWKSFNLFMPVFVQSSLMESDLFYDRPSIWSCCNHQTESWEPGNLL